MNKIATTLIIAAAFAASPAFAQKTEVKGKTEIDAKQENVAAVAIGKDNTAKNTAGAIKGDTTSPTQPVSTISFPSGPFGKSRRCGRTPHWIPTVGVGKGHTHGRT